MLAAFVGFEVISKVPATLHTPLMSQTNAIHGIVVLGGLLVIGYSDTLLTDVIGWIAIVFGTINVVGGFLVTDRMLGMFVRKPKPKPEESKSSPEAELLTMPVAALSLDSRLPRGLLHRRVRPLHPRHPPGHPSEHRQARQHDRRRRHGDRRRRDAAART